MTAVHAGAGTSVGGALATLLSVSLSGHLHEGSELATADAGIVVTVLGAAWALAAWFVAWRAPAAPALPTRVTPPPSRPPEPPS
jgi:hypothetical protein